MMLKIAYDAKRFFHNASGLGNYSRDLVRILAEYYPKNQYFLLAKKASDRGEDIVALPQVSFKKHCSKWGARQLQMGIEAQKLRVDIFHGLSGELPLKWNGKALKKVVTIHDLIFMRYPQFYSFIDRKLHYWKFKKAAQQADLIIAISEQTKQDIIHFLQVPEKKIRVIYQGCHQAFKADFSTEKLELIRKKYNLPQAFLLNVGTIEPRKNMHRVVQALAGTSIPLVLVGKTTPYDDKIQQEAQRLGVSVQRLTGVSMEDLAGVYRLAKLFIYPSLFEGFGIPVIEALFSGTPVITSNVSSLPEAGGTDSLYIDPKNIADIRAKILFLWDNPAECQRRIEKGLDYVQRFQDEVIAAELMAAYRAVLER